MGKNWNEITRGAHPVTLYKRRTTIIFGISGLVQISRVILSYYILGGGGGRGVCVGNVPVKNNDSRFLFHKANLPIFIHTGRSYTLTPRVRSNLHSSRKKCSCNLSSRNIKPLHRAAASIPMNPHYGDLVLIDAFNWLRHTPARLLALIVFAITNQKLGARPHLKTKATN